MMSSRAPGRAPARLAAAFAATLLLVASLGACGASPSEPGASSGTTGNGDVVTELRELPPFTRVSVAGGFKVILGEADAQQVSVGAQQNLLPSIRTDVRDGQLIVTIAPPGINATQPLSLTLKMTDIESVSLSNGSVGFLEHTGSDLVLDVSGGAELTAIGDAPSLELTATSGSHAKLGELQVGQAQIDVNDGSSVELNVVSKVAGMADGGSTVILKAKPAIVDVETKSGATIQGG